MAMLMKGETWQDGQKLVRGKPRFEYPVVVEAKADEIRCRVVYDPKTQAVRFESYAGKPLHNLEFLANRLWQWFQNDIYTELDVGILVNKNFNDSYRWVRSSSGYPVEKFDKKTGTTAPALAETMVQVILFDLPQSTLYFESRLTVLDAVASEMRGFDLPVIRPRRLWAMCPQAVETAYNEFRAQGYEGAMVKTIKHVYARRRTFDWLKYKPSETFDGRITGFVEATSTVATINDDGIEVPAGTPLGRAGSIQVELDDGSTATPAGIPHGLGRDLWERQGKYIGQWVEFSCMERDRKGGYRHPVFNRFREDKA